MEQRMERRAPTAADEEEPTVLTKTEARQGETSGHVRLILAGSLTLALVVFIVLYLVWIG